MALFHIGKEFIMSVQRFKVAVNAEMFPLLSPRHPRAVSIPGADSAPRTNSKFTGNDRSVDYNLAQVLFAENMMPQKHGVNSAGYLEVVAGSGTVSGINTVFSLRDDEENIVLYSPGNGTTGYLFSPGTGSWTAITYASIISPLVVTTQPTGENVSYAYVDGKTFVCFPRKVATTGEDVSILYWNPGTGTLELADTLIANLPFAAGTIDGVSSSNGYLLVWSGLQVAWTFFNGTAFDFEPFANGEFTGAGSQIPEDIKGPITATISVPGGFLMFTTKNCIAAQYYAQNVVSPWLFREVQNAGGLDNYENMSIDSELEHVYAYTTSGMQKVNLHSADTIFPELTDFIVGGIYERYDYVQNLITTTPVPQKIYTKVAAIANRYIVLSYGHTRNAYEFAFVYDMELERWGKLRVNHSDCLYYPDSQSGGFQLSYNDLEPNTYNDYETVAYDDLAYEDEVEPLIVQQNMGFVNPNGQVQIAVWLNPQITSTGSQVLKLGKMQLTRARNLQFNRVELEAYFGENPLVEVFPNGRSNGYMETLTEVERIGDYYCGGTLVEGKNIELTLLGRYGLSSFIVEGVTGGSV